MSIEFLSFLTFHELDRFFDLILKNGNNVVSQRSQSFGFSIQVIDLFC